MREIKFRAWDVYFKQMFGVIRIDWLLHGQNIYLDDAEESCSDGCELMQYTGLKDKNGKEIYEGDILKDSEGIIDVVIWYKYRWELDGFYNSSQDCPGCAFSENAEFEIVGNIYENPELLEKSG